jgi:CRAL/TRIO domain
LSNDTSVATIGLQEVESPDIGYLLAKRLAVWTDSFDKMGRRCCVVVGRHHSHRGRVAKDFKRFLVHTVEAGCLYGLAGADDEASNSIGRVSHDNVRSVSLNQVCVIYDRRGFTSDNTDPDLVMNCQKLVGELRRWYGARLGVVYVLYTSLFVRILLFLVWPLLYILSLHTKLVVVQRPEDLLEFFYEEELVKTGLLGAYDSRRTSRDLPHDPYTV